MVYDVYSIFWSHTNIDTHTYFLVLYDNNMAKNDVLFASILDEALPGVLSKV